MKKYISLFSFIALFFVGMQFSAAQDAKQSPEAIAKQKTYELHELVTLSGDQQSAIYKVLLDAEQNSSAIKTENEDVMTVQKTKGAILENVNSRIKAILTPEQFQIYIKSLEKK